ncbi:hypothetical protein [Bradyrhizobium sp. Ec3.3]|uniref:hypothetical protein n=1 Tax=Bradyrhizobium sp. Ec3.3 TaxID=189753 RepID=UPI0012ECAFF7|nr:hypothetical protein [Bradyrhizobium sp. Ec3.3]
MQERFYVITIRSMNTSEDADLVLAATFVVSSNDFAKINLPKLAAATDASIADAPVEGLRPMTLEEVDAWRAEDDGE